MISMYTKKYGFHTNESDVFSYKGSDRKVAILPLPGHKKAEEIIP